MLHYTKVTSNLSNQPIPPFHRKCGINPLSYTVMKQWRLLNTNI